MKRFLFIITVAATFILSGCHKEVEDAINEMQNTKVDFTYSINGMTVSFTPDCDPKVKDFEWLIGEDVRYKTPNPTHTFKTAGTYKVQLIGKWGISKYNICVKEITISEPTPPHNYSKAYIKGFRFNKLAWDKAYYRCRLTFETLLGSSSRMQTQIKYIKNTDLPYELIFNNPYEFAEFPNPYDWFTNIGFELLNATIDNESALKVVLTEDILPSTLNENITECTVNSSTGNTSITILFEYK